MKLGADTQSGHRSRARDAKRNFILQQGLSEPVAESCPLQYSALLFQPRIIALWLVVAVIMQKPSWFFALAAVLWWSALAPRLNPFDALYNWTLARRGGPTLTAAPAPRRFAQALAGLFALAIGVSLTLDWRTIALVIEGFFIVAVGALAFGGFCLGSFVFHLVCGRADFAKRTLPWATGA
jgi:Domain of unknown function (DUF4395)